MTKVEISLEIHIYKLIIFMYTKSQFLHSWSIYYAEIENKFDSKSWFKTHIMKKIRKSCYYFWPIWKTKVFQWIWINIQCLDILPVICPFFSVFFYIHFCNMHFIYEVTKFQCKTLYISISALSSKWKKSNLIENDTCILFSWSAQRQNF